MIDKTHTFINLADDHEYESFYDFGKTYEAHPNAIQMEENQQATPTKGDGKTPSVGHEWEDIDFEDANEEEVKDKAEIEGEKKLDDETQSFSIVDTPETPKNEEGNVPSSSEVKPDNFGAESVSSIKQDARKGKTREEAALGLNIKQAELMDTGEIRLPNGKIVGHRQF